MTDWVFVAATAFIVALVAVPLARSWALRGGVIDVPNERSSHTVPKPRIGGVGVILGVLGGAVTLSLLAFQQLGSRELILGVVLLSLGAVGLVDDVRPLAISKRMPLYMHGALFIAIWSARIGKLDFPFLASWSMGTALSIVFTTLFIGWYTNLFNFMDGTDGIAGCAATVTTSSLAIVFGNHGEMGLCLIAISIAAATLGFLPYNFAPSTVFMGDVGSVFLGTGCGALTAAAIDLGYLSLLAGVLLMFPFVFDATFTLFRRALRREKVWQAHRSHIYQQLCDLGMSHRNVAICYSGAAVVTAALGLAFDRFSDLAQVLCLGIVLGVAGVIAKVVLAKNAQRLLKLS